MMDPKPPGTKLDSGTIYNRAEGFWICPSFKDLFLPCQYHDSPLYSSL
jgi:hypothetical protein